MPTEGAYTVLIADDHEGFRRLLRDLFAEDDRFAVVGEASSGYDAAVLAVEIEPDIVLLDLSVPPLGGLGAARMIRMQMEPPRPTMVLVTSWDDAGLKDTAFTVGISHVLDKKDTGSLLDQLIEILDHYKTRKEA